MLYHEHIQSRSIQVLKSISRQPKAMNVHLDDHQVLFFDAISFSTKGNEQFVHICTHTYMCNPLQVALHKCTNCADGEGTGNQIQQLWLPPQMSPLISLIELDYIKFIK